MNFTQELKNRINQRQKSSLIDVHTYLENFAIISYKVAAEKLVHLIPDRFNLWTFKENNTEFALVSAVVFKDHDFSFYRVLPHLKFNFHQTNFRTYVIDKIDHSHCAWFFGTTLGSFTSIIPKHLWKMPWERGSYNSEIVYHNGRYEKFNLEFESNQGSGKIKLFSTHSKIQLHQGFNSLDEQLFILTHPVKGYYKLRDNSLGTYEIWHPKMNLHEGKASKAYFEFFEKLGLLNQVEMMSPHSVLITNQIEFDILMPPKKIKQTYSTSLLPDGN